MLTLWGRINSINVQKVLWMLAEIGIPYQRIDAGRQFGVTDTPEYKAMNPTGRVPTIDDDGFVLWESNVIIRYLAAKHAYGTLYPEDLPTRFAAERWMDWQASTFSGGLNPLFIGIIRTPPEKRDAAALETARLCCEDCLAILDATLADRPYISGDDFGIADIVTGTPANRWFRLPIAREPRPNVQRWLARLGARPAFKAHLDLPLT